MEVEKEAVGPCTNDGECCGVDQKGSSDGC